MLQSETFSMINTGYGPNRAWTPGHGPPGMDLPIIRTPSTLQGKSGNKCTNC